LSAINLADEPFIPKETVMQITLNGGIVMTVRSMLAAGGMLFACLSATKAQEAAPASHPFGLAGFFHRPRPSADCPTCVPAPPPSVAPQPLPKSPDSTTPQTKDDLPQPKIEPAEPRFEPLVSAALGDNSFATSAPQMIGDFGGTTIRRTILVPVTVTKTNFEILDINSPNQQSVPSATVVNSVERTTILVPVSVTSPLASRTGSGFKIADNASPLPTDRVYFSFNYFDSLNGTGGSTPGGTFNSPIVIDPQGSPFGSGLFSTTTVPGVIAPNPRLNLNREIFGLEKTFWDGNASAEVRVPIYQSQGSFGGGFQGDGLGDITAIVKFALINNSEGNVLSVGLATTFPTGPSIQTFQGNINSVLLQPFAGYIVNFGDAFIQGFSSVVAPTESKDIALAFNDIGAGYRLYRGDSGSLVSYITPVGEAHVTTPLESRNANTAIWVPDIVSFTGGVHIGLGERTRLSLAANLPVTGPQPYDAEYMAQINFRY